MRNRHRVSQLRKRTVRPRLAASPPGPVLVAAALLALVLSAQAGWSVHCPPRAGEGAVLNGDVDGDGKNDYHFPALTQKDASGNSVDVYCLQPSGQHGWQFRSYYTDKATGKKYFIGGCFFPEGQNKRSKEKHKAGPNKGDWKLLDWDNWEPRGDRDWHFEFDPATKKLVKKKTKRTSTIEQANGLWYDNYRSQVIGVEEQGATEDAFEVTFEGVPLMEECVDSDCGGVSVANLVVASQAENGLWNFSFLVPSFTGSGTLDDPIVGAPAWIRAGDTLTFGGLGLVNAFVGTEAADPANGGWAVSTLGSEEVTFVATVDAEIWPERAVEGFYVESGYPSSGPVPWDAVGDNIRYDGMVEGPGPIGVETADPAETQQAGVEP